MFKKEPKHCTASKIQSVWEPPQTETTVNRVLFINPQSCYCKWQQDYCLSTKTQPGSLLASHDKINHSSNINIDTQSLGFSFSLLKLNCQLFFFTPETRKAGKITEINHIDKPDKLHLAGRVNRAAGHAVRSEAERRAERREAARQREGGREGEVELWSGRRRTTRGWAPD